MKVIPIYGSKWTVRKEGHKWVAKEWLVYTKVERCVNEFTVKSWEGAIAAVLLAIELRK